MIRFGVENESELSPSQRIVFDRIVNGPRGRMSTPFWAVLASPRLADKVQDIGAFLRYGSGLAAPLRELAIVSVAVAAKSGVEFDAHSKHAREVGVPEISIAHAAGAPPQGVEPLHCLIVQFARDLTLQADTEPAHARELQTALGDEHFADLVGVCGYYRLLATYLRMADLDHWVETPQDRPGEELMGKHV